MTPEANLCTYVSLGMLWYGVFWLYQDYFVDKFRQDTFKMRDALFDEALGGRISFDDPIYGYLRTSMNGAIRFAHAMTLWQLLFAFFRMIKLPQERKAFAAEHERLLAKATDAQKELYGAYLRRLNRRLMRHMLVSSPLLAYTIIIPIVLYTVAKFCAEMLLKFLQPAFVEIDALAHAAGDD